MSNEILMKAAQWLEDNEWCQEAEAYGPDCFPYDVEILRSEGAEPVACCAVGALKLAAGGHSMVLERTGAVLARHLGLRGSTIPEWNDKPGRTKEEVIQAMREAAK